MFLVWVNQQRRHAVALYTSGAVSGLPPLSRSSRPDRPCSKASSSDPPPSRAEALAPERRSAIAQKAATARWGQKLLAIHKGNFKDDFGIDVDCYVLNDERKTAVISQRGMGEALGLGSSGSRLPRFVSGKAISEHVGPELREKLEKPVIFQAQVGGPETLSI